MAGNPIKELQPKKRFACTKNLVEAVKSYTSGAYNSAKAAIDSKLARQKKTPPSQWGDQAEYKRYKDEVDQMYRTNLCRLDTDIIEAILLCHNKQKIRRAGVTLAAIKDELARRAILGDSSREARK